MKVSKSFFITNDLTYTHCRASRICAYVSRNVLYAWVHACWPNWTWPNASTTPVSQCTDAADRPNDSTTPGSSPTELPPVTWYQGACSLLQPHPTNAFSVCPLASCPQLVRTEEDLECRKASCARHVRNTSGAFAKPARPRRGWSRVAF